MNQKCNGSIILFALLLIMPIIILATTIMQNVSYLTALAGARQEAEYHYWATYGLLQYGRAVINQKKEPALFPIIYNHWPHREASFQGELSLIKTENSYLLTAQLKKGETILHSMSCAVDF